MFSVRGYRETSPAEPSPALSPCACFPLAPAPCHHSSREARRPGRSVPELPSPDNGHPDAYAAAVHRPRSSLTFERPGSRARALCLEDACVCIAVASALLGHRIQHGISPRPAPDLHRGGPEESKHGRGKNEHSGSQGCCPECAQAARALNKRGTAKPPSIIQAEGKPIFSPNSTSLQQTAAIKAEAPKL